MSLRLDGYVARQKIQKMAQHGIVCLKNLGPTQHHLTVGTNRGGTDRHLVGIAAQLNDCFVAMSQKSL